MRALVVAAGLCTVLAVAGCGKSVSGQPSTSTSLTKADLYDPCTLPDDVITAAGANPATKDDNPFLVARDGWKGCVWDAAWYSLDVYSTTHSIAEFKSNDIFHDFRDVRIGVRAASTLNQNTNNAPPDNCGVLFGTSRGTIQIMIRRNLSEKNRADDLCAIAVQSADVLDGSIPN
ncbi:DUF3558 family protein [Nocardia sp. R6R-6]|uniref:DUF3558 family protein n=1 Tax=Nocardia sp. R6R-6 TaxID=3459303 RepID=UPI00403D5D37